MKPLPSATQDRTAGHFRTFSTRAPALRPRWRLRLATQRALGMTLSWLALMFAVLTSQPLQDRMTLAGAGFWLRHLGLDAQAGMFVARVAGFDVALPAILMHDSVISMTSLAMHIALLALTAGFARRLAHTRPSLAWALGVLCVVHGIGVIAVAIHGGSVTSVLAHTQALSLASRLTVWLMPAIIVYGLYVLEAAWPRRLLGSTLVLGYLVVALPIKLVAHAWLISLATPLIMPALFLVGGPALDVAACAGILSWLLSLPRPTRRAMR